MKPSNTNKPMELAIAIEGKIVKSNFDDFKASVTGQIEAINYDLKTDEEFIQAKQDVTNLSGFESDLDKAETDILKQMEDVHHLITGCRELKSLSRDKRLLLNKTIKDQTAKVKKGIEDDAVFNIKHGDRERYRSQIVAAMKGKRTLETLKKAADETAAEINQRHEAAEAIIETFVNEHGQSIAPDASQLIDIDCEILRSKLSDRVALAKAEAEKKAAEEKLREAKRKEQEEKDKAEVPPMVSDLPDPPKVENIEVGKTDDKASVYGQNTLVDSTETLGFSEGETVAEEMEKFCKVVLNAFGMIKGPRLNMVHAENRKKGQEFADAVLEAYNTMKGGAE